MLAEVERDYATRTHKQMYNKMEALMEPRRRLVDEDNLPPINFTIQKKDLDRDEKSQM